MDDAAFGHWRDALVAPYEEHFETLRGRVRRSQLVAQVTENMPRDCATVLDVGAGSGDLALALARVGCSATLLDPSSEMLERAETRLRSESAAVRRRVRLVNGSSTDIGGSVSEGEWDLVVCHGVMPYFRSDAEIRRALVRAARPGGMVSCCVKNVDGLALRPALEGRWADARAAVGSRSDVGYLGQETFGRSIAGHLRAFRSVGMPVARWYGVRTLTNHRLHDHVSDAEFKEVLELEQAVACIDPYRRLARLVHLVAFKTPA